MTTAYAIAIVMDGGQTVWVVGPSVQVTANTIRVRETVNGSNQRPRFHKDLSAPNSMPTLLNWDHVVAIVQFSEVPEKP